MAIQKNSLSPTDLVYAFASGFIYDLATLSYVLIPIIIWLTIVPLRWRKNRIWISAGWVFSIITAFSLVFLAVSEWVFWGEFESRFNFIAVDYLVYTNEVIGNIRESYPLSTWLSLCAITSIALTFGINRLPVINKFGHIARRKMLLGIIVIQVLVNLGLSGQMKDVRENRYANELAGSGLYSLFYAFNNNELNYRQFYQTEDTNTAEMLVRNSLATPDAQFTTASQSIERIIHHSGKEKKLNVVLISVESLSADYLGQFGNSKELTPNLDHLADSGMLFTRLYATGNRTVRGLEALSLVVPPTPGQSIVRRPNNESLFSLASVFNSKGYDSSFLYGGYGTFDNMNYFFGSNGYNVKDRLELTSNQITHENIWGVADEDLYNMALRDFDQSSKTGKPFFHHWMTVSNHRPFTYPDGRIDIPGTAKSRNGGVKYADYSLKKFFELAKKQAWYKNTVFVIVSDHCASSAGKTELPLDRYRIPGLVFSEGFVKPQKFNSLMSQIDVMPTVFGLLNFNYQSKFLGQDIFSSNFQPRAYVATYQDLGLIKDNYLTVISPVKKARQYFLKQKPNPKVSAEFNIEYEEVPATKSEQNLIDDAVSAYQSTSYWLKKDMLNK